MTFFFKDVLLFVVSYTQHFNILVACLDFLF